MPFVSSDSIENASNPVNIVLPSSGVIDFDEALVVTDNTQTTVVTYTAVGSPVYITKIMASGDANSTWVVEIDTVEVAGWKIADGNKTRDIDFNGPFLLAAGSTIDVKAEHFFTGETANFKSTIIGYS
jgi:hypothetical protein